MGKGKDTVTSFNSSSDKGILLSEPWELPLYGATIIKDNLRNVNEALASGGPLTAVPVRAILFPSHVTRERRRLTHGHQCPQRPQNDGGARSRPTWPGWEFLRRSPAPWRGWAGSSWPTRSWCPLKTWTLWLVSPVPGPAPSLRQDCGPPPGQGVRGAEHPVQLAALLHGLCGDQLQRPDALSPPTYLFRRHRILAVELEGKNLHHRRGLCHGERPVPLELTEGRSRATGHCEYRYQWEPFFGWVQSQRLTGV